MRRRLFQVLVIVALLGVPILAQQPVRPVPTGTSVQGVITSAMSGTTSTSLVSGTASNFLYIQSCHAGNNHATVDTYINLQDGSGGTTLETIFVPHGGGNNPVFVPFLKVPTSGNALFAANVTTGSSTNIGCQGFRSTTSY